VSVLGKLRGLARAGGAVMTVDQLVFSAIAFALQAAAIPVSTDAEFGVLSLVMMIQTGQWYVGRALASEPMVVSRTAAGGRLDRLRGSAATALGLGLVVGLAAAGIGLALDGPARTLLLIQAVASPFLAVLDHSRYVTYGRGKPLQALALDGAWLVLFGIGVAVVAVMGGSSGISAYLIWAGTGIVVALAAVVVTGVSPLALRGVRGWVVEQRRLIPGFLVDATYLAAGTYATFAVAIWAVGLDDFGLLRKAFTPVTALTVLFVGIGNAMLAHLAGRSPREVVRTPLKVLVLAGVISTLCALAVLVAPAGLMTTVLQTDWSKVLPLVLILLVYAFFLASGQTAMVAAKATGRAWLGPRVRTVELACELILVATFGLWLGVTGVAVGMATAWLIAAGLSWYGLLRHAKTDEAAHQAATTATTV
jgi:hypothetical protein